MGYIIDHKDFINDNIFKYEKRLESQYTIFLDKNPTFVTYYHINDTNSITDNGFVNVEKVIGSESPLRYQQIDDFPIYGIDQIVLDLSDEEQGLTSNYEGDAIILPNTIKPKPNDIFTISYLKNTFVFMVTQISYDSIKSNNYYRISYYVRSTDGDTDITKLQKQIIGTYKCIFNNIGTDDKCLIKSDEYYKVIELQDIYKEIVKRYITLFYSEKFNSLVLRDDNTLLYDKYITHFISKNNLLNQVNSYDTIELSNEDDGTHFLVQYEESFFDIVETCDKNRLQHIRYNKVPITFLQSVFKYYNMLDNVKSVVFPPTCISTNSFNYINDELIDNIMYYTIPDTVSIIDELIIEFFNEGFDTLYSVDMTRLKNYRIRYTERDFRLMPVILYILKYVINKFLHD